MSRKKLKEEDFLNKVLYQKYLVLEFVKHPTLHRTHFKVKCLECSYEFIVRPSFLKKYDKCRNCYKNSNCKTWKGFGEISGYLWGKYIRHAKERNLTFSITKEFAWNLFLKQNRKCALSNLELTFPKTSKDYSQTASLDRIDSSKGYTEDNVQWVHKDINRMKMNLDENRFIYLCKCITTTKF